MTLRQTYRMYPFKIKNATQALELVQKGIDLGQKNKYGKTPLHMAIVVDRSLRMKYYKINQTG